MRIINHCRLNYQLRISGEYQTWFCFPEISFTPIYCKNLFQFDICGPNCLGQLSRAYVCRRNSQIYFSAGNAVKLSFCMGEFVRVIFDLILNGIPNIFETPTYVVLEFLQFNIAKLFLSFFSGRNEKLFHKFFLWRFILIGSPLDTSV